MDKRTAGAWPLEGVGVIERAATIARTSYSRQWCNFGTEDGLCCQKKPVDRRALAWKT